MAATKSSGTTKKAASKSSSTKTTDTDTETAGDVNPEDISGAGIESYDAQGNVYPDSQAALVGKARAVLAERQALAAKLKAKDTETQDAIDKALDADDDGTLDDEDDLKDLKDF